DPHPRGARPPRDEVQPMPDPTPSRPASDRNLLFGILALQMDFIGRDALIAAMGAWILDKAKSLGQILQGQGALAEDERAALETLVDKHLRKHGGDPERSLASVESADAVGSVREELVGRQSSIDGLGGLPFLEGQPDVRPQEQESRRGQVPGYFGCRR